MPGQLSDQKIQNPYLNKSSLKKRNYIILATVISTIVIVSLVMTYKNILPIPQLNIPLISSCQPAIERTPNRKAGIIAMENMDKSFTNVILYSPGEDNITRGYSVKDVTAKLNLEGLILRGGKVINVDQKNKILTIDVGDGNKMTVQTTENQIIKIKKPKIFYGHPTSESFIGDAKLCHIQKGDVIGLIMDKSYIKTYDKILIVPAIEIIQ